MAKIAVSTQNAKMATFESIHNPMKWGCSGTIRSVSFLRKKQKIFENQITHTIFLTKFNL